MAQRTGLTVLLVTAVALTAIDQARKTWVRTSGCRLWRKRPWTGSGRSCRSRENRHPAPLLVARAPPTRALAGCRASTRFWTGGGQPQAGRSHQEPATQCGQADADCRHRGHQTNRLAADKPEYETAGSGAGEGVLAFGTPCAI